MRQKENCLIVSLKLMCCILPCLHKLITVAIFFVGLLCDWEKLEHALGVDVSLNLKAMHISSCPLVLLIRLQDSRNTFSFCFSIISYGYLDVKSIDLIDW
jgi:hypothetical protein